ncbi:Electron transfer flavoprotein subunit beta, putative [Perkinsus marinus ATCC 50983]|uniref:Electron transfer flavoprotein subunit beta n=1 Tax=Perkinsus marinus (strain ATCC 50983 / TXsc) TaxID=423536 RepID=C5LCI7_PERM5|nr:Electron transfer flavoprotein subunit beta, putative [Perkinsus marinus ATCC 50983]EER05670.1 Electron transfer flavoprotein subunit beta, putative [Perkinsus marinus ATCC 50983]|eukprot:XP_002773854.1 Electron transfer flavoprotein subunit beta, putative [Perkinsus marinus ATCC 50983]
MSKALVCIKRVVDYAVKVRVMASKAGVDIANVKHSVNPFCEIAVEEALRMKEAGRLSEVVAVCAGPDKVTEQLRQVLAMGCDRAIHLQTHLRTDQELPPLMVAKLIKKIVEREDPLLVLMGKQAIDGDMGQTSQLLAGMLGWPQATCASKIVVSDDNTELTVDREVDTGIQTVHLPLPAVMSADLRLNTPRYATLPNLMKAKKKPIEVIPVETLGVDLLSTLQVTSVEEPPARKAGVILNNVDELVDKLKNEAKVV